MGCHTWFSVPYITDKEKIKELAKEEICNECYTSDFVKMYLYAIDNGFMDVCCELAINAINRTAARYHLNSGNGIINMDIEDYALMMYCEAYNVSVNKHIDSDYINALGLDYWHDTFRVGGYPEVYLNSFAEVLDFINKYEIKYNTRVDFSQEAQTSVMQFFEKYPNGNIHFG